MSRSFVKLEVDRRRRDLAHQVRRWTLTDFHARLEEAGVTRAFIVHENGEFSLSHPKLLAPLAAFLELSADFARHEAVFIGREPGIPSVFFAFVHDTRRGLAQGGLRFKSYPNLAELVVDGLRLSQGMTRKNALAGLWWGGGKGILSLPPDCPSGDALRPGSPGRTALFEAYGRFIASLGGVYYTAEDIGTKTADMDAILGQNRFITCISRVRGGSGNPSPYTARGVFKAMQAAWLFLHDTDRLAGIRVAVQGAGNVGAPLVELLDDAGASVWVCDVDAHAVAALRERRPRVQAVSTAEIFDLDCHVFAPCAIGAQINRDTIPRLKVELVCGAANNILREPIDAERLKERGIAFVPDYVCNRMGIVNCADEWLGYLDGDIEIAAERVYPDTLRVLKHARNLGITSREAADKLADIAASELHPLLGHRGRRIIDRLVESGWHRPAPERVRRGQPAFVPALDEPDIRVAWQRRERFGGQSPTLAAAPISAASRPTLATVLPAVLMDVRARALTWLDGAEPRRIVASEHGGLELQLAVERAQPYEREALGRPKFVELCRDYHDRNDAAIREQLHQLGVLFDPTRWLDPMHGPGREAVRRLYFALADARMISRDNPLSYRCPRCRTVCVALDVARTQMEVTCRYEIRFTTGGGAEIETTEFFPELVLGAVAIAVDPRGRYRQLIGQSARVPVREALLPVIGVDALATDAEFIVPAVRHRDAELAASRGITELPRVFDERGEVWMPQKGEWVARELARKRVLEAIGPLAVCETGRWLVEARRCRRCETVVLPDRSQQSYVRFDRVAGHLRRALESGAVEIQPTRWRDRVLDHLRSLEPWCISRQYWWGNENPVDSEERLSTWFSMVAVAAQAAGWPAEPTPSPIDEVFVDPDFLIRWVVPAELVGYALLGRPIFRRVRVHGSVHVMESRLEPEPGAVESAADEDRWRLRSLPRRMRPARGNVVEPAALIRRFGADALRLGYLLCLDAEGGRATTLSEGRLRGARRAVQSLSSKVTGLFRMFQPPLEPGAARLTDRWVVASARELAARARAAYLEGHVRAVAELFLEATDDFARYAAVAAARRRRGNDAGAIRAATREVLGALGPALAPVCPYLLEKLSSWVTERCPAGESLGVAEPWLVELVALLDRSARDHVELGSPDARALSSMDAELAELELLTHARIVPSVSPGAGIAEIAGKLVVVRRGEMKAPAGDSEAAKWYRALHSNEALEKAASHEV